MHLRDELERRGFLHQYTDEKVFPMFDAGGKKFYFGVDPSADSMTIGNFVALMQCIHFMLKGNKCYLLVGGATGMIGNPTGKDAERNFLDEETLQHNQEGIYHDFQRLCANIEVFTGKKLDYEIVNNYDWFKDMHYLQFLRDVGKHMTVNRMMNKDIVRNRINDPEKSISYAEFSYMLIMGYDFYVLHREYGVELELGGSDERDGILAGIEITHKLAGKQMYGVTNKLIVDATGKKFGKSEGNAIWLNPTKSTPYFVYQYFMNTTDADVERYLKLLTLLDFDQIEKIITKHQEDPAQRYGQEQLAKYVVATLHGEVALLGAQKITAILFGAPEERMALIGALSAEEKDALYQELGGKIVAHDTYKLLDLLTDIGITSSNGDAKKMIKQGSIFVNETKIDDMQKEITVADFINGLLLLRKGKKTFKVVKVN